MGLREQIPKTLRLVISRFFGQGRIGTETVMSRIKILRKHWLVTRILGPLFTPNHFKIEIEITTDCNLNCYNCNRSCRQAPSDEHMSLAQIEKFVAQSVQAGRHWARIRILGGEPTLHPQFFEILDVLLRYKKEYSPETVLMVVSNGFGDKVQQALAKLPPEIVLENTNKKSARNMFDSFNVAPIDLPEYKDVDYINACHACSMFAMALTRYGYYPSGAGAGIDRVFGFNIGKKTLPPVTDNMQDQLRVLCRYCGHFKHHIQGTDQERFSPAWQEAYRKYALHKPKLDLY
ncbi:MAG: radical SAM protein [Candidatus Omnitrophota bacterium]